MAGLRLVHSWCLCCGSGLRVEFLRRSLSLVSAPLCLLRSGSPVLRFSAPVGICVQPVLQRINDDENPSYSMQVSSEAENIDDVQSEFEVLQAMADKNHEVSTITQRTFYPVY